MTTDISPPKKPIKVKDLRNTLRHLMPYMRPYKNYFLYAMIGMGLYSLGQVGIAALVKVLVDQEKIFENVEHSTLLLSIGIFSVFSLRGLGNFLSVYFLGIISTFITRDIRQDMFRRLLHIPLSYYDQRSVGQILSKLTYNVERITIGTSDVLVTVVRDFIVFVGLFFWVIYLNWLLAVFLVILGLPISLLVRYATKRFQKIHKRVQEVYGYINADIHLAIENNMSIKVSNAQDYMQQKFEQNNDMIYWQKRKEVATRASNSPLLMIVASLSLIFLINLSAVESVIAATSIGTLASAVTAIFMIFRPLNSFARLNTVLQASLVASDSVFSLLKEPLEDKGHLAFSSKVPDTIEFNNVSFRYKNATENALSNINLTVRAGESIAIVGASGSGKSTLVSLIPRLYTSSSGGIYIDGQNIKEINLEQLRSQISYAGQFSMSVHDTIADSIRYGQNASLEEIREATRQAYLLDFIESLPDGFDTPVAQNTLSSGQIQRIILARTLLQNLPILIFDEMTSALDQTTEQKIHATLRQTMQGRTCFIISHRFTVIHLVKRIIVMKGGRIVEQGTHDDLLAQQSEYYKLYTQHH